MGGGQLHSKAWALPRDPGRGRPPSPQGSRAHAPWPFHDGVRFPAADYQEEAGGRAGHRASGVWTGRGGPLSPRPLAAGAAPVWSDGTCVPEGTGRHVGLSGRRGLLPADLCSQCPAQPFTPISGAVPAPGASAGCIHGSRPMVLSPEAKGPVSCLRPGSSRPRPCF